MGAVKMILWLWALFLAILLALVALMGYADTHREATEATQAAKAAADRQQIDTDAVFGVLDGGNVQ